MRRKHLALKYGCTHLRWIRVHGVCTRVYVSMVLVLGSEMGWQKNPRNSSWLLHTYVRWCPRSDCAILRRSSCFRIGSWFFEGCVASVRISWHVHLWVSKILTNMQQSASTYPAAAMQPFSQSERCLLKTGWCSFQQCTFWCGVLIPEQIQLALFAGGQKENDSFPFRPRDRMGHRGHSVHI